MSKPARIILCFVIAAAGGLPAKGEKPLASVPFLFNGYEVLIAVNIDGAKDTLHFLFDSGCEVNVLSADKARALGLTGSNEAGISGWSKGVMMIPKVTARAMTIGGMAIPYPEFYLQDISQATMEGKAIDGIIGYSLLKHYAVKIDFQRREMRFYRPGKAEYPAGGERLPLAMNYKTPTLQAAVTLGDGTTLSSTYHLVTGGHFGILFNADYVKKYGLAGKLTSTGSVTRQDLAGPVTYTECSVPGLELSRYKLAGVAAMYSPKVNDNAPGKEIAGAIGASVWKNYLLIIDLSRKQLYLKTAE